MQILTVNAGSSSVRLGLWRAAGGAVEPRHAETLAQGGAAPDEQLARFLDRAGGPAVDVVAHRFVHGGPSLTRSCELDAPVEEALRRAGALAPLHNPPALAWVAACRTRLRGARQVAVLDTAFFADLPEAAATYALPRELQRRYGLRRYGFHGLAHQAMWRALAALAPARTGRVITFQLGSGASAAAIRDGRAVETSMGFTPLEGLVMATRAGDVDPGLLLYLLRQGLSPDELDELLSRRSGLYGLGGSGDMRALLASEAPEARAAVAVYLHRARKYLGAYLAVLGGADAVVVGGGVGEHAPAIRAGLLEGLEPLGFTLDPALNDAARAPARISADGSPVEAWVIAPDEARLLAEEAVAVQGNRS